MVVSTLKVPSPPEVLTKPLSVRLESLAMFWVVFMLKALPEYVRPVPAVVVAALVTCPPKTPSPPSERDGKRKTPVMEEEAFERKPPTNSMMVEVACSPPVCLVQGKANDGALEREPFERVRLAPMVRGLKDPSAPMYGILERRVEAVTARFVVVAWVEVLLVAVKFWRVDEPLARKLVKSPKSEVSLPITPTFARRFVVEAKLEM